ncbi:uncharacterized protein LOC26526325 isoform X1 [Drosophila erecta]|uniref:uncharacterized protein LOC26526325 isoform X1 n=1 Tax=Drosophila erecta TaxID=7220 RepID=UPI000F061A0C|nr:uncharacterized protein LOC26526325 isoform X1 [Drosophila erecta]XP_026839050.1 uncharacterized protein LOC26526325 isoform X1 [Drosophila erecta]XP_026839051.1 uncharacterized protein LOC26526325 isoform X1 [Drosophila erecta]XP_026839052.1 uncharacterized protein LOC26526325 isoform X1 [Drosophila erecta]
MLQPREDNEISDIYHKKYNISTLTKRMIYSTYCKLNLTRVLFTTLVLIMIHIETSQAINQSYYVSPTPSLPARVGDDITTVLLVNNESGHVADFHGRFLTVRPDIGVLTSTARTFIQDGITTEFATKILGTTLNNGRLYAQYLRKSSRVLYENENVGPSVVTSWVGEEDSLHTPLFLQSHNDLFNFDDSDWQDIDDSIGVHHREFVGNTDFVIEQSTKIKTLGAPVLHDEKTITSVAQDSNDMLKIDLNKKDEMNRLIEVLSIKHLQTYTVKSPSENFTTTTTFNQYAFDPHAPRKEIKYERVMQPHREQNYEDHNQKSRSARKQILATVTYYGFADFTTIVGDSVIVFSPSTTQSSLHYGHVTSIKGKPTLQHDSIPIEIAQTMEKPQSTLTMGTSSKINEELGSNIIASEIFDKNDSNNFLVLKLKPMNSLTTFALNSFEEQQNASSVLSKEIVPLVSNGFKDLISPSNVTNAGLKVGTKQLEHSIPKHEGATTVFIDDDPFSSFDKLSDSTSLNLNSADQIQSVKPIQISKGDEVHETVTHQTNINITQSSLVNYQVFETSNENHNFDELCNHTTSQVFLTQMTKANNTNKENNGRDTIVINANPLHAYEIIETTKYYCIQASQSKQNPELNIISVPHDTVTKSSGEFMSINIIDDDKDETTVQDLQDYEVTTENEYESEDEEDESVSDEVDLIYKTLYTTYTYLTTFFEGSRTTISSHTEVLTNIVSSTFLPESKLESNTLNYVEESHISENAIREIDHSRTYTIPDEIASLLAQESKVNTAESSIQMMTTYLDDLKFTKTLFTTYTYYTSIFTSNETAVQSRIEIVTNYITKNVPNDQTNIISVVNSKTTNQNIVKSQYSLVENKIDKVENMTFGIGVNSSIVSDSSPASFNNQNLTEDQVSSESNTEEIIPSATFLLQTSFTTFTFYTTMYVGDDTSIISRHETITNVATETLQPTKLVSVEDSSFPITYFTTFTYWTKLAKDGEITTLSREETLSNVIQHSNGTTLAVNDLKTADMVSSLSAATDSKTQNNQSSESEGSLISTLKDPNFQSDITTFYTTYTYYTTSYDVNTTFIDSRLETVTNIMTSREISNPMEVTDATLLMIKPSHPIAHFENPIETINPNVVLYDYKQIIDAEKISTLYFTTEIVSSINSEGHDIKITSSTSRLHVDQSKKSSLPIIGNIPDYSISNINLYKTGLVRLIEGKRIQNSTTTLYQSRVIGTVIDNRYAQIIESTSSFFFEKTKSDHNLFPTSVKIPDMITKNLDIIEITELTISENDDSVVPYKDRTNTKPESDNIDWLSNHSPQSSKRPFAPVIRPFASRNRPTFAPKQKTLVPSSATIITRSDITPTITATPALKSAGRYTASRRGIISNVPINANELNLSQSQSSRRLFGRPSKSLSSDLIEANDTSNAFSPSSTRFASAFRPVVSSRRQNINVSYRSSSFPVFRGSGVITNSRLRIKPTSSGLVSSYRSTQSSTFVAESSSEGSVEEDTSTDEVADVEEGIKNNNNSPLLRFRRPINAPSGFIPAIRQTGNSPAVSLRRNPLSSRAKISTTTTSTTTTTAKPRARSFQRPIGPHPRSRPQNTLFPPRGLFQSQLKNENLKAVKTNDSVSSNDFEYEGSVEEQDLDKNVPRQKRSIKNSAYFTTGHRFRRQADTVRRNKFRFRRQNQTITTKVESKLMDSDYNTETILTPRDKSGSRFGSRFHSPQGHQLYTQALIVDSTTATNHRSIRPSRPTTKRPQFTLREKDGNLKGTTSNNFRRQPASGNSSKRRPAGNSNSRRLKSYVSYNKNSVDNGRQSSSSRSRNSNSNTLNRGRSRGRKRIEYASDLQSVEHELQSITVTHFIPSEVAVPVVSGHVTEYKNIVTAKSSTEIVGPNEFAVVLGTNGMSSTYLNRETSIINIAGATEHTKYLLHESITSSVTFTPTTIRGRKTSFSHIIPSTAYSVEHIVTTIQPQITENAPLANILLSQLLLGNLNLPAHPLIGAVGQHNVPSAAIPTSVEPITEYRTHTSTYVTTIFDGMSTILPVTFQGKKILTTVYDTTAQTITATEYSVDTIINTQPSVQSVQTIGPAAHVNNLLLQHLLIQQQQESLVQAISNTTPPQVLLSENLQVLDDGTRSSIMSDASEIVEYGSDLVSVSNESQVTKSHRKKSRKTNSGSKKHQESSIITLYVSGRRPGEFSTVLSTVREFEHSVSLQKRHAILEIQPTNSKNYVSSTEKIENMMDKNVILKDLRSSLTIEFGFNELPDQTASLESIVGDVHLWFENSNGQSTTAATLIKSVVI